MKNLSVDLTRVFKVDVCVSRRKKFKHPTEKVPDLFSSVHARVSVSVALGLGVVAATFGYFYRKKLIATPPKKWIRVGELTELIIYPVKSCAGIPADELNCTILGLFDGELRDRTFSCVSLDGTCITGRSHPKMVLIQPRFENNRLILSAPKMPDVSVDVTQITHESRSRTSVWSDIVTTVDCGDEVAKWLSNYLLDDDHGVRLVFYPEDEPTRDAWSRKKNNRDLATHAGALHDVTSYMMLNQASVDDLNTKLTEPVTFKHFRPNFLVNGNTEYAEDKWVWVKIGNVIFKNVMLCGRCIFTNINPETGKRNPDGEPLNTLRSYRMVSEGVDYPILGIHLGVHTQGLIKKGDPIYVGHIPAATES
ncbi:mitochondrial amidoxime reducing component [Sergentomyia squamirostris]